LYVEDLQHDTLLFVKKADANFHLWKLLRGKVSFTSILFDEFYGNLVTDSTGRSNIDYIIQAFEKPQDNDSSEVEYKIGRFDIKNSTFCYTNLQNKTSVPVGVFNGNSMKFSDINASISVDILNKDTLQARLKKFSATEKSGFTLTNLTSIVAGSPKGLSLPVIDLQLPNSRILLENVQLKIDSSSALTKFSENVRLHAPIVSSNITLSDFSAFVPEFKNAKGVATIKGLLSGRLSSFRLQKFEVNYGNSFFMQADLDVSGLPNLSEAFFYGQINDLHFDKRDLQDFISDISRQPFVLPKELNQLGLVRYKGNITGFLSNLVAYGNLSTNLGSISTDILLQFDKEQKDLSYNGTLKSTNLQLGKLLNSKELGKIAFNFNTKGIKKEHASLKGEIKAKVPEFQFNNYTYRDIEFTGKYDGSGFDGKINVEDENIHARFLGIIDLTKKLPVFDFDLKVYDTNLYALKLINSYPNATVSFKGKTNMV
jgi:hypothetical protein